MNEADFEWSEKQLRRLARSIEQWDGTGCILLGNIRLEAEKAELTAKSDVGGVEEEFGRLLNTSFDLLMDYEEHQRVKEELRTNSQESPKKAVKEWIPRWRRIAEKLGISHVDLTTNTISFSQLQILPNVVPTLVIAHTSPQNVIIVRGKRRNVKEEIDLQTVLRHSYSNIPNGSLQTIYLLTKNLLDLYSQLFSRQVTPEFCTRHFRCLPSLWLQYDLFGAIFEKVRGTTPSHDISLDEATANWVHRRWDNYQYLTFLNELSGRVRGEVHNHPIFPWVCDFTSSDAGFRPLNRTKYRLCKGDDQLREMFSREPSHHVPELLSDIGYMVYRARLEPKENLCKHVRRKWVPEEYPSTMSRMYQWTPDECIPEFYDDPSIFKSRHHDMLDLQYPEFVSSPEEFINWHRKMLEDEEVSSNLHRWIDLVFGYNLSLEDSKNALNLHLCFVEKNRRGLRTNGMVQLFDRPHPKRIPLDYDPKKDFYQLQLESFGYGMNNQATEESVDKNESDEESHYRLYQKIKKIRRLRHKSHFSSMVSLMEVMAQIVLAPQLAGRFDDAAHIRRCIRAFSCRIPVNFRKLFDFLLDQNQDFPEANEFAFFASIRLNIPTTISSFAEEFSNSVSLHLLRKLDVVPPFSKRSQLILLKEVESLKKSIRLCHHMESCVVAAFRQLLEDEEACIHSVHRLMPVITRSLSQSALEDLINPMIELIQCETSVKLLDRRFLMNVSICYGTHTFLDLFLPPIVEACASLNCDRSVVAKESIMWLAKRYGPVICAKFISSNLLRIMASCYEGFEMVGEEQEPSSVFNVVLQGDETCSRIESLLSEIVLTYSVTFITVQFLPFCVDFIEQFHKRPSVQLEPGLVSVFRIVELSIRSMSDHQLMNYLEEFIIQKVIYRVLTIMLDTSFQFSSARVRSIIICKVCQLLHSITQKIGTENTRIYASQPFKLLFSTFSGIYETNEELRINLRKRPSENTLFEVPLWIVEDVIEKFAKEWGVPYLSSFCDDPAFLIPFVSNSMSSSSPNSIPIAHSPPNAFSAYSLGGMSSGNRLFSLSASSPVSSVNNLGGLSLCESGALSAVWCARVSAAVCGVDNYRFDHLSLCNFTGHQERIRKLAAISNENSFVSASSDKTVKLWSIKPELDEIGCQWTYQNHTRPVHDVSILADNSIASTDGILHVWDPFRTTLLAQMEWDSKEGSGSNIMKIENVDRHILAAICSLHSSVKLFDSRVGGWTCELKVTPGQGLTRALTVRDNGNKMAVALSNGTLAILDARNGKINALAQTNSTHTVSVNWLSDTRLLVCDADECGIFLETNPRAHIVKKLQDPVSAAFLTQNSLVTLQHGSMLRVYRNSGDLQIETKMRPDELPGTPTAVLPLPLNCSYLIGSSHGAIRLMC